MIQRINITNFQSHRDTTLDLSPGVNVIVGPTDCGKTAIIRALRWLKDNRPTGEAFRSTWGGETKVDVVAENQHWFRSKDKDNHYHYNGTTFAAFGTEVPHEIRKSLNLDDINLQMQMDSPFLISSSPGEVAAFFNQIAHLEKIDIGLKSLNSTIKKLGYAQESYETQAEQVLKDLSRFEHLDKAEADLEVLEQMEGDRLRVIKSSLDLQKVVDQLNAVDDQLLDVEHAALLEDPVNEILEMYDEGEQIRADRMALSSNVEEIREINEHIQELETLTDLKKEVDQILRMWEARDALVKQMASIYTMSKELKDHENGILDIGLELRDMEKQFHKEMPEVCPLCGK